MSSRIAAQPDLSKYEPVASQSQSPSHQIPTPELAGFNTFLVCPMPLVSANPDGLRQFYRSGVPQIRLVPPGRTLNNPLS